MKIPVLTAAFLFVASALPTNEWTQYKDKYQKVYTSKQEDTLRYNQYLKTKKMIDEHNIRYEKGETSYWMGINHFSDWFPEEVNKMLDYKPSTMETHGKPFQLSEITNVPDSINWVEKGAVTSVKDQKTCKSDFAFSVAGAVEGLMFITNNTITDLSAQELVDCSPTGSCTGSSISITFSYVITRGGIDTSASYPYEATEQNCLADSGIMGATCHYYGTGYGEQTLKTVVGTMGPAVTGFFPGKSFLSYKGGIFDGECSDGKIQNLLVVGYDKDNKTGKDYWLIKNSWGGDWGEKGYARLIRNVNKCHFAFIYVYPSSV